MPTDRSGWLAIVRPAADCTTAAYASLQASVLACPLYTYGDEFHADVIIANCDRHCTTSEYGHILGYTTRKSLLIIDAHDAASLAMTRRAADHFILHVSDHQSDCLIPRTLIAPPLYRKLRYENRMTTNPATLSRRSVGWVGDCDRSSGLDMIAGALEIAYDGDMNVSLAAVGYPTDPDYCDSILRSFGRHCHIDNRGRKSLVTTISLVGRSCDLFCLPGRSLSGCGQVEQSSIVGGLLSVGKPVLASDDRAYDDFREFMVTVRGGAEAWAHSIRAMLLDAVRYQTACGLAARFHRDGSDAVADYELAVSDFISSAQADRHG